MFGDGVETAIGSGCVCNSVIITLPHPDLQ